MCDVHCRAKAMVSGGLAALLLLASGIGDAHNGKHHQDAQRIQAKTSKAAPVDITLFDLALIDQDGRSMKFRSDVIADKIVVMDFIYTTCTTVCPVLSAVMAKVQQRLGSRLGKDVFLVSVSVDPVTDRPPRLKAYAKKSHARPGWIWLTGEKLTVDKVLEGLGAYAPNYEDHPAMVLVGDGRTGQWARFFGFPSPAQIMAKVDRLSAARKAAGTAAQVEQ